MRIVTLAAIAVVAVGSILAVYSPGRAQTTDAPPAADAVQKRLFVITFRPGPAWRPGLPFDQQGLGPHFHYWKALFEAGDIFVAGAVGTEEGLVVFHAADQAAADQLVARDPAVTAGIFLGRAQPYNPPFLSSSPLVRRKP